MNKQKHIRGARQIFTFSYGGLYNGLEITKYKFYFLLSLKTLRMNMHNGEKRMKTAHISVNIGST